MGAEPYWYTVRYQPDIGAALQQLREQEFRAGRYNPVIPSPSFPIGPNSPAPGARHASMAAAFDAAGADGTRSIIDLGYISDEPEMGAVSPLSDGMQEQLFGTTRPTRQMVLKNMDLWERLDRFQGVYVVLYKDDQPDEIYFAGYSCD
jgi:hypothetical protein